MASVSLQLEVIAYDSAYPSNRATTDVTIFVLRNVNGPIFIPSATYQQSVQEDIPIGTSILTVSAQDRDAGVRIFQTIKKHQRNREMENH